MKKLLIATAIAALISPAVSASAVGVVDSNITGLQLWLGQVDALTYEPGGYFSNIRFGGTATDIDGDGFVDSANISMQGEIGFTTAGLPLRLTFNLSDGGFSPASGINFTSGTVQIDAYTNFDPSLDTEGDSFQWFPFMAIDASVTNLPFLANMSTQLPGQTTAGIIRNALPGLWDGVVGSVGFNLGVGVIPQIDPAADMYLQGSIFVSSAIDSETGEAAQMVFGPSQVPIPAAAWLFGSGLAGLAGVNRMRRLSV